MSERSDPDDVAPVSGLIRRIGMTLRQRGDGFTLSGFEGLSVHQGRVIGYIEANESRGVIQRDIAAMSGTRAASVSSLLQGLERDGWIERRSDRADSRRKTLHVTAKSRALLAEFDAAMERVEADLLEPLSSAERDTLVALLAKVDQHFD